MTQLETMVKNEEFNTEDFSCDPESLVVKPYVTCHTGQILVSGLIVWYYIFSYLRKLNSHLSRYDSFINSFLAVFSLSFSMI